MAKNEKCGILCTIFRSVFGEEEHTDEGEETVEVAQMIDRGVERGTLKMSSIDKAEAAVERLDQRMSMVQRTLKPALTIEEAMQQIARTR